MFITPFGVTDSTDCPLGSPQLLQRRMTEALTGLAGTVCMMDGILVHGASREEHDQRLEAVLKRFGMTLNVEKCTFVQTV